MTTQYARPRDLDAAFAEFDAAHPEVWDLFQVFTRQAIAAGRTRYSADAICHRIRWEVAIARRAADEPKINNNWTSRYARKWAAENPLHADFFETRVLRSRPPEPGQYGRGAAE